MRRFAKKVSHLSVIIDIIWSYYYVLQTLAQARLQSSSGISQGLFYLYVLNISYGYINIFYNYEQTSILHTADIRTFKR